MEYVTYIRVSTAKQGESGLGLAAQQRDINIYLDMQTNPEVIAEFTDVESGKANDRPQLSAALDLCRETGAVLLVAKLDRLSRSVAFVAGLMEDKRLSLAVAQMPHADKFQLHIYAALAEQERDFISARTKAALAEAKSRGVKLGGVNSGTIKANAARSEEARHCADIYRPRVRELQRQGMPNAWIAEKMAIEFPDVKWYPVKIGRI